MGKLVKNKHKITPTKRESKLKKSNASNKKKSKSPNVSSIGKFDVNKPKVSIVKTLHTVKCDDQKYDRFIHNFFNSSAAFADYDESETIDEFLINSQSIARNTKCKVTGFPNLRRSNLPDSSTCREEVKRGENKKGKSRSNEIKSNKKRKKLVKALNITDVEENDSIQLKLSENELIIENEFVQEEEIKITGSYELFDLNEARLLVIDPNSTIYFHGLMEINVLLGTIEILGKKLDNMSPPMKVYSPRGSAFLSITNKNVRENIKAKTLNAKLQKLGLNYPSDFVKEKISYETVLIECKRISDESKIFIEENVAQVLYPEEQNVQCAFKNSRDNWTVIEVNPQWGLLPESVGPNQRVILCGGKGVGKSTLLRYLINRALDEFNEIVVVDLDPGQPEFTVPGCISIVSVKSPLLGPNYTHLLTPIRSIFIPDIDISADFDVYLSCVTELVRSLNEFNERPILVNYMGFAKGIGLNLTSAIIDLIRASTVVQMESSSPARNFTEDLNVENVDYHKKLLLGEREKVEFSLVKIKSMCGNNGNWEMEPRQVRELCILSYLSRMLPEGCSYLTDEKVKIYRTTLSDVKLIYKGTECDAKAVNANLVGLCRPIDANRGIYDCLGWGIVRGVCVENNFLNLLTPLKEDELENADHLVLGSVTLPPSIYIRQHQNICGLVPYVYKGELSSFARTPKRSLLIKK